ncbi:MAG TPA: polyphenol oxidase family protein [Candidatus Eisenbacteria bacterium]|nr:polyphenol oxidase family protein [Candidatus Eisenbacteria bacterium]
MWTLDPRSEVPAWRFATETPGPILAFSTRRGGVSEGPFRSLNLGRSTDDRPDAVTENRRRLLVSLGLDPDRLATAGQVHGAAVTRVLDPGLKPGCDALVTTLPGLALAVTAADCLPLLYEAQGAVAAAHSGWRGTVSGAPEAALAAICSAAGVAPATIRVHLGPGIRGCCYQVGPEVAAQFPDAAITRDGDTFRLDLPTAARLRLRAAGVPDATIHDTGACTACEPAWYFSHRRDRGITGRQWGVIALAQA